jgi:hypothetical protein
LLQFGFQRRPITAIGFTLLGFFNRQRVFDCRADALERRLN